MSVKQEDVRRAVLALRQLGCAVVIFSPEALQGVSREDVERHMYFTASEFIDDRRAKEVVA